MGDNYRHHHASRDGPIVVLVPVPVAGSPEPQRHGKPPAYKRNSPEPWRPQRSIPVKQRKAEAVRRLLENINRQDQIVHESLDAARTQTAASHV
jgi:hypothetical protein